MIKLPNDYRGKAVLITGGTKGIGLATGLAFGRLGAHCYLTHHWGSADEEELRLTFAEAGAPEPAIVEADVSNDADTEALLEQVHGDHDAVEVFVSNVGFAQVTKRGFADYQKRALLRSLGYSSWPLVGYLQRIHQHFGRYPRYALGLSNDGPETYIPGYDFVALTKQVMETFCRYLAAELLEEDIRINILRTRGVATDSLLATFGEEFEAFHTRYFDEGYFIKVEECADAAVALCSGLMDGVAGQVILLDRGYAFCDNLYRLFEHRQQYGL
jgi:NAD(P)-dependent dehydrogenase (short-subunit alcohol dehydrogenase family)